MHEYKVAQRGPSLPIVALRAVRHAYDLFLGGATFQGFFFPYTAIERSCVVAD